MAGQVRRRVVVSWGSFWHKRISPVSMDDTGTEARARMWRDSCRGGFIWMACVCVRVSCTRMLVFVVWQSLSWVLSVAPFIFLAFPHLSPSLLPWWTSRVCEDRVCRSDLPHTDSIIGLFIRVDRGGAAAAAHARAEIEVGLGCRGTRTHEGHGHRRD